MTTPKTAILLTTFGSADDEIREKTFGRLAEEIREKFPAIELRQAFTSNFMIRKLARRGISMTTPTEEISNLRRDGYKKIFLLPTHLTPGEEFDIKIKICAADDVKVISPLLTADCSTPFDKKIFDTVLKCFARAEDEDLILIGHGSPHRHNPVYENLQRLADNNTHIGVIEETDTPNFADVLTRLKNSRAEKILLAPLLFNGGVHVAEDIAGEDDNSWLNRLIAQGYRVRLDKNGLGSFEIFRKLYIDKLEQNFD
ncbi:MAG: sirohydrochlorin cobaltochelatase [Selenomonadaceae bacterium]|nr:sirohydrochlorin cobaltochelatase [Selenomonadaceae bacterium]